MKSNRFRFVVFSLFSLGVLGGITYFLYINASRFMHLLQISVPGVIIICALSLATPVVNGLINIFMFRSLGANLSLQEGFYLAATSTLVNQLPLPGGIVARGIYLKHKHGLSYPQYFSASLAIFFCAIAVNGLIGIMVLLYWFFMKDSSVSYLLVLGFSIMVASLFIFFLPVSRLRLPDRIEKWIGQTVTGWTLISTNLTLLTKILFLQVGFILLFAVRQWMAFYMLSQSITISQAILLSSGSVLTQLVSFAPGGLGVREAIIGGIASILGFDLAVSIAAVELDRVISSLVIVLVGWISTILLGKKITETQANGSAYNNKINFPG